MDIFGIHEQALKVREERGKLIASNLANSDTPGYKAKDIDFRAALSKEENSLAKTHKGHMGLDTETSFHEKFRVPTQNSIDGNTVEDHIEKTKFAENAIQQQATLEFINSRISSLRSAIRGE